MPHLDMTRSAGSDQVDHLVSYLSDFSKNNPYGKPVVIVFHFFANDPWESELCAKLRVELPQNDVAVKFELTLLRDFLCQLKCGR